MPFPFHRLHCDLQTRLRALATPSQLYHLQIAVGDAQNYLYPVQPCHVPPEETDRCLLEETMMGWKLIGCYNTDFSEESKLVFVKHLAIGSFSRLNEDGMDCLRTHGVLDIKKLEVNEELDALTLRRLSSVCSKTCKTMCFEFLELLPEITFQLIFTLFPNLDDVSIYAKGKKNWINDLLELKKTGMKHLEIVLDLPKHDGEEDNFAGLSYIQPKSVFEFCKTQPPDFKLEFHFVDAYEPPSPETWDFLKPYFRVTEDEKDCKIMMTSYPDVVYMYACYA